MKNLKFGVLLFGALGLIACFLPFVKMGEMSASFFSMKSDAAANVYVTMIGFALAAVAGVMGAAKPPFGKPQAGMGLVGFALALIMMSDKKPWKVFELFTAEGMGIGAKLMAVSAIAGLVVSILALIKSEEA